MNAILTLITELKREDITPFSRFKLIKNYTEQHCNDDINNMLWKMGWDNQSGFEKEPAKDYLIERLENIAEKYTVQPTLGQLVHDATKDVNFVHPNTFSDLIIEAIEDVKNGKYNSKSSLLVLVERLDKLSSLERGIYGNHIDRIKNTIKGYNNTNTKSDLLTNNQLKALTFILEGRTGKKKKFNGFPSAQKQTNLGRFNKIDVNNASERTIKSGETQSYNTIIKFDADDMITEASLTLLTRINSGIMSSGITVCLLEYLEILQIALEEGEKYQKFYDEIMIMLEKEGWGKNGGFQREPKKISIGFALSDLIVKYMEI